MSQQASPGRHLESRNVEWLKSAAVVDDKIFAFGADKLAVYDPQTDRWSFRNVVSAEGTAVPTGGTVFIFMPYYTLEFEPVTETFYIHTNQRQ